MFLQLLNSSLQAVRAWLGEQSVPEDEFCLLGLSDGRMYIACTQSQVINKLAKAFTVKKLKENPRSVEALVNDPNMIHPETIVGNRSLFGYDH